MKISALTVASMLAVADAFAPSTSSNVRSSTSLNAEEKEMSKALPFVARPKLLDGTLAGDVGFDPFGFAGDDMGNLVYMREAEIKHSRLAMLAVIGWPISELLNKPLADSLNLPTTLTKAGSSPAFLNGGLDKIDALYWLAVISLAGVIELENSGRREEMGKNYIPGDCGFDPLGLFPSTQEGKMAMMTKEIKHGRIAMMAILGFVVQEALYRTPVVVETPQFFTPAL